MGRQEISREQLFAMVWERPTQQVAKELGVSDVAVAKLCARLQVPKPPRGYWARVQSGRTPRRPPLTAFREELERSRQEDMWTRSAGMLTALQRQFYEVAISELEEKGIDVSGAQLRGGKLPDVSPDIVAQILLLIQNRGQHWVEQGKKYRRGGCLLSSSARPVSWRGCFRWRRRRFYCSKASEGKGAMRRTARWCSSG